MKQFRCTRNKPYHPDTQGFSDRSCRQGYYIDADTKEEALQKMAELYPDEFRYGFTLDEWKPIECVVVELAETFSHAQSHDLNLDAGQGGGWTSLTGEMIGVRNSLR